MTPERWRQIESIYHAALERPPTERMAFLDEQCAEDRVLRRELDRLLAAHEGAKDFMSSPAWELAADALGPMSSELVQVARRIGSYEVLGALGVGAMGEVYRAHDTRLNRDVALKILPERFVLAADRLARFRREAQILATLNHPNIGAIYGLEESGHTHALVLELVDGLTLADRISRGSIPVDEALAIARQIAEALEAAHEHGIIHRDLKPANIKIRADGTVKVLDFGLAKALHAESSDQNLSTLSTAGSLDDTRDGVILGTAAYIAPDQARGKPADRRADIWALGCVLYEMLTGRRAFSGEDVSATLSAVVTREPDWDALPGNTPPQIRRLLQRCLAKDRKARVSDASIARIEIDDAVRTPHDDAGVLRSNSRLKERMAWATALVLAALIAFLAVTRATGPNASVPEVRFEIDAPFSTLPTSLAVSPDGQKIIFAATFDARSGLWVRRLESASVQFVAGTAGAQDPFWAPDSRSVGFFADGKLKTVDLATQAIQTLVDAPLPRGGTWSPSGVILYAPTASSALFQLSTAALESPVFGETQRDLVAVTRLEEAHDASHRFPQFLPDGRHFVYCVIGGSPESSGVYLGQLDGPARRRLVAADSAAVYAASGHLLFVRQGTLFAQTFDLVRLEPMGNPFAVTEQLVMDGRLAPALSASAAGPIVYRTGSLGVPRQFVWFDRSGNAVEKIGEPDGTDPYGASLSPDGRYVAVTRTVNSSVDVWLLDTKRSTLSRFTSNPGPDNYPQWSPDGRRIVFASINTGVNAVRDIYEKPVAGAEEPQRILTTPQYKEPVSWSRDGRFLLYRSLDPSAHYDLWALAMDERKAHPVVRTGFDERDGEFSPDGKWIAYQSNDSGRFEIYLQPFLREGPRTRVSTNGGAQVRWREDGQELFYVAPDDRLMAVPVRAVPNSGDVDVGTPVVLFQTRIGGAFQGTKPQQYIVAANGQRFLMNTVVGETDTSPITVILNWKPKP